MIIRPFQQRDQKGARQCIIEGLGEHFGFVDESCNPDLDDIGKTYSAPNALFLIAVSEEGNVIGTGCLLEEGESEGRVVRMSVEKSWRRRGVARHILARIITEARARGMESLVIATEPHWNDAVGFYRANGFVQYGADDVDVYMRLKV